MNLLKTVVIFLLAFMGVPLSVGFIIKTTGKDDLWGVVKISQFFVIFYYYGIANAEHEINKGMFENQLPQFIKWLLFLDMPNRFTMHTIVYQAIVVIMTMIALLLIFFIKIDSNVVAGRYFIFGFLVVAVATIFWRSSY